ncbi:ornithine cyclodeaminase [Auraticoccus sp. F435]|uniref:Ornithine cyclodeaminase n=1 Tax=Auraticoccus cholistanensis TaxID=2656650 RepID=A0A6A9UZY5_9ACTN|nr:ornithine cyclodeaminase [Auraticoccus cholistanensis]MVA74649.1 ornithine cyclodeaminase [Auraticoccus cholistanensis]
MVAFLDVAQTARWVARRGPERVIAGMVDYLERDFARWEHFDKTPRVASHTPFGVIELMPTSDGTEYAFKYVNGHPSNPARGFSTVTAFGALADVHNGYPTFISEMTLLTALRTAATSALAARRLARPDAAVLALVGAGSQAEFQALGMRAVLGIDTVRVVDVDPAACAKVVANLAPLGFRVDVCADVATAVEGADVVTTCTADKTLATVLRDAEVGPGVHVNAIGGDCPGKTELDPTLLRRSAVFVEFEPQTRVEGEIQQLPADFPVTELWRVLTGAARGRTSAEQVTVFDSVGFAVEDFSALRYVRDDVRGSDLVVELDLVAAPADPKDLFALVGAAAGEPAALTPTGG